MQLCVYNKWPAHRTITVKTGKKIKEEKQQELHIYGESVG